MWLLVLLLIVALFAIYGGIAISPLLWLVLLLVVVIAVVGPGRRVW